MQRSAQLYASAVAAEVLFSRMHALSLGTLAQAVYIIMIVHMHAHISINNQDFVRAAVEVQAGDSLLGTSLAQAPSCRSKLVFFCSGVVC